jgi:hypothetical protein
MLEYGQEGETFTQQKQRTVLSDRNLNRVDFQLSLFLLLQGYRPQACFRPQENASSHLAMGRLSDER